ncbi:MAG: GntR family transcriptional regulator [Lachnospiraceae bacterium]|nr:GntR family transcriptional regulator [Lachnospiraceae bacterium]
MSAKVDELIPLRDVVFKKLRRAILLEELKAGERLTEIRLADRLGVSRTPIREAMRKLELEGLVVMVPRRGAVVAKISEKNLRDVLEIRRVLDMLCARLACERMSEEAKEKLNTACQDFEEAVKSGDLRDVAQKDVALHNIIIEATGNLTLQQMLDNLAEQMYRYRVKYLKDDSQYQTLSREHRAICKSIMSGDQETAVRLAKEHIDNQETAIIRQLRAETV